jgi:YggT family protein
VACVIHWVLGIYWAILFARVIASWFELAARRSGYGPGAQVVRVLNALTDPVLRPVRGLLPPIRMGGMGLDLSPIIVFIVVGILFRAINCG